MLSLLVDAFVVLLCNETARPRDAGLIWLVGLTWFQEAELAQALPAVLNLVFEMQGWEVAQWFGWVLAGNFAPTLAVCFLVGWARSAAARRTGWRAAAASLLASLMTLLLVLPALAHGYYEAVVFAREILFYSRTARTGNWPFVVLAFLSAHLFLVFLKRVKRRTNYIPAPAAAWLASVAAGAGILALGVNGVSALSTAKPTNAANVLLVSVDSLRADHVSAYGHAPETTPTIDRLASEGVLFETAVSPTSWTLPSHTTMFTSLPPAAHGVINDGTRLGGNALTLAEVLQDAGFQTAGVIGGPYLHSSFGLSQGFQVYDDYSVCDCGMVWGATSGETSSGTSQWAADWLRDWSESSSQRPFFLFLHFWDVHFDYSPPPPYDTMFDPDYTGSVTSDDFFKSPQIHKDMDPRDLQHVKALYDGEIRYTDSHLGKVINVLEDLGQLDETLIVVTSDHGDEFFEHGAKGHRNNLYEETIRVPLVMRWPETIPPGVRVPELVGLLDLAPTILSLVGVERPSGFGRISAGIVASGIDLTPWIRRQSVPSGRIVYGDLQAEMAYVRTETVKMVVDLSGNTPKELYDLRSDPRESINIFGAAPAADQALGERLARWREAQQSGEALARHMTPSQGQLDTLRALGYLQ